MAQKGMKVTKGEKEKQSAEKLLALLKTRNRLAERFGKPYLDKVTKWEKDYNITTIADAKFENLDNQIQIPYIFSTVEGGLAEIFDQFPGIIMKQRGKEDREFTDFSEQVWDYLKDKLALEEQTEDAAAYFLNNGQATARYGWEPGWVEVDMPVMDPVSGEPMMDETGNPMTQKATVAVKNLPYVCIHEPKTIHFSPESHFVLDDESNKIPYATWHQLLTKDQAEEYYGIVPNDSEMETVKLDDLDNDKVMGKETQVEQNETAQELKRVRVINYVGILPKEDLPEALKESYSADKVYYCAFTKEQMYRQPEEITKKPLLNLGNYGLPSKFWRFGEAKVLRELEQDVSLGRSRIMDLRDRQGVKIAIPQGTEFDENSFKRSRDYTFMRFIGNNPPAYLNPPTLPESIMVALQQSRDDIQMASAQMDISRGGDANTVNTATGQKIFAAATNKRNNKKRKKVARFLKALAKNLLILCGQNWDAEMFAKITDIPVEVIKQNGWVEKLAELGEDYDVEIDIDSMGDTKESDAANALAMYREMKDSPYINQEELIKMTLKVGFKQKDSERLLSNFISPDTIIKVIQNLLEQGILMPEDAQMIAEKLDASMATQAGPGAAPNGSGNGEGRPAVASPTEIMKNKMPGTDATQMTAQRGAAYKQMNVPKGPQMTRR